MVQDMTCLKVLFLDGVAVKCKGDCGGFGDRRTSSCPQADISRANSLCHFMVALCVVRESGGAKHHLNITLHGDSATTSTSWSSFAQVCRSGVCPFPRPSAESRPTSARTEFPREPLIRLLSKAEQSAFGCVQPSYESCNHTA